METKAEQNITLFQTINTVGQKLKKSKLSEEIVTEVSPLIVNVATATHTTERQALLYSIIFYINCNEEHIGVDFKDISRFLDADFMSLFIYQDELDHLLKRQLLQRKRNRSSSNFSILNYNFTVPSLILDLVLSNKEIPEEIPHNEVDVFQFVGMVSDFIDDRDKQDLPTSVLFEIIKGVEEDLSELSFIRKVKQLGLEIDDRTLFYEVCDDFIKGNCSGLNCTLVDIYSNVKQRLHKSSEIIEKRNQLIVSDLIELEGGEFLSDAKITLSDKGKDLFLDENKKLFLKKGNNEKLIYPDKISRKELFYDAELHDQIAFIEKSLDDNTFTNLQARLTEKAMPKGVAAIFYGAPGTGKTETVYQVAKATGRAVMHVDISQSKSMWFGESEKRIKDIFVVYKKLCESEPLKPILLFNEADAIFGKRKDSSLSGVAQTENAMQNIILEEMEKLEGILIATTNLNKNLDAAFERRFLFKVEFKKPSFEAKQKIWRNKIPWLTEAEAASLASNYSFSGGEIDNIVRKITMDEVLNGVTNDFNQVERYCKQEFFAQTRNHRVGFISS